jgi:SET domain-containing protein
VTEYDARSRLAQGVVYRPSRIDGLGLFAASPLPAGTEVVVYGGRVVENAELADLVSYSCIALDENHSLLQQHDDPARLLNHSCDANLHMAGRTTAVASRDIAADEEITLDYATVSVPGTWRLQCRCGSANCRGTVSGGSEP